MKNKQYNYYIPLKEADKLIDALITRLEDEFGDEAANMARETAESLMNAARLQQE